MLSPIPSRSHGTNSPLQGLQRVLRSTGRVEVDILICTGKVSNLLFPVAGNFERTQPREDTGSSCLGVRDSRLGDNAQSPGFYVRSGH